MRTLLAILLLTAALPGVAATIGIDQPEDGTKYALLCERIESVLLAVNGDVKWGGLPTWKAVKGSTRVEACPMTQGNWFEFPTEKLRSYQITVRVIRYDAKGEVLSNKLKPPYFYFHGPNAKPLAPVILLSI